MVTTLPGAAVACRGTGEGGPTPSPEGLAAEQTRLAPLVQALFPGFSHGGGAQTGTISITVPPHCYSERDVVIYERRIRAEARYPVTFENLGGWELDDRPWSCGKVWDDWPVALVHASVAYSAALLEGTLQLEDGCLTVDGTVIILPYPGTLWDKDRQVLINEMTGDEYALGHHIALGGAAGGPLEKGSGRQWVNAPAEGCYGRDVFGGFVGERVE